MGGGSPAQSLGPPGHAELIAGIRQSPVPIVDYETFKANQDVALTELAWLWNMNRGI
jgi:glutamate-1-semialdehyde 2,1-aminomutase